MNTMQQEFDAVVAHLFAQGRPAKNDDNTCFYRAPFGSATLSCAVGCRIPDAIYTPEMDATGGADGTDVDSIAEKFYAVLPEEIVTYLPMFRSLQAAHDYCFTKTDGTFDPKALDDKLARVAARFDLTYTRKQGA